MPSEKTREKALSALEGMHQIVARDRLAHVGYVSEDVDEQRAHSLCQGRRACALGSLWLGYGVKVEEDNLPGTWQGRQRKTFLRTRPGLRAAYDALNAAAEDFAQRNSISLLDRYDGDQTWEASVEQLFETSYPQISRREMLSIISAAKRKIKNA